MQRTRSHALPAVQDRSRQTREVLLEAAELVLARDGVDGATIPAIAEKAGVAVGSVYRRFPDKDALLRAVYDRFFDGALESNRAALNEATFAGVSAEKIITVVINGMVRGYRLNRPLLRALLLYAQSHDDPAFRRHATHLRTEAFRLIADLLEKRSKELRHPHPREAVNFALTVVGLTIQGLITQDERGGRLDDDDLVPELTRMVTSYLGSSK